MVLSMFMVCCCLSGGGSTPDPRPVPAGFHSSRQTQFRPHSVLCCLGHGIPNHLVPQTQELLLPATHPPSLNSPSCKSSGTLFFVINTSQTPALLPFCPSLTVLVLALSVTYSIAGASQWSSGTWSPSIILPPLYSRVFYLNPRAATCSPV